MAVIKKSLLGSTASTHSVSPTSAKATMPSKPAANAALKTTKVGLKTTKVGLKTTKVGLKTTKVGLKTTRIML